MIMSGKLLAPVILSKGSEFCIYLPDKNIMCVGESLDELYFEYEKILAQRLSLEENYEINDSGHEFHPNLRYRRVFQELGVTLLKTASVVIIAVFILTLLMPAIRASLSHHTKKIVADFTPTISNELYSAKYWAIEVPSRINERYDQLSAVERDRMNDEWSKLLARIPFLHNVESSSIKQ